MWDFSMLRILIVQLLPVYEKATEYCAVAS